MNRKIAHKAVAVSGGLATFLLALGVAGAQEPSKPLADSAGPWAAPLQLGIGVGYTQGFGVVVPTVSGDQVAQAGLDVSVSVDHRVVPRLAVGVQLDFVALGPRQDASAGCFAANLGATYHLEPTSLGEVWLRAGAGYRMLFDNQPPGVSGPTLFWYGVQVLTTRVGYDLRIADGIALGPVIGVDLNAFLKEEALNAGGVSAPPGGLEAFVVAGVQGRFGVAAGGAPL